MKIKLTLQYDGTAYHGWQIQKNAQTVQQLVKDAVRAVCGEDVKLVGCGRTDAGVHARMYIASFETFSTVPPDKFAPALNTKLPADIRCTNSTAVPRDFDAKNSAVGKKYVYRILNRETADVFERNYSWHVRQPLDTEKMRRAAKAFLGEHDFLGFAAGGFTAKTTVRTIYSMSIEKNDDMITVAVIGNGFLYNMVRIIAGTLVFVGLGKIVAEDMADIIASCDRRRAGITAPPQGLFLEEVYYSTDDVASFGIA